MTKKEKSKNVKSDELSKMIEEAKSQPGIEDLLIVMGQYDQYRQLSAEYLQLLNPELETKSDYNTNS